MCSLWFSSEVYFMSKVYTLFIPEFTEIADNHLIISYSMSREWVSNQELKGMQEYSIVLSIRLLSLVSLWLMIPLNSLVFIFSTLLVHLDFKNILYLYGVNNTKVSKIWQSCKIKQKTTPNWNNGH